MIDLNKEIPGFANPQTRQQVMMKIDQYALGLGFSQKEIQAIKDPRLILLAYKAMTNSSPDGIVQGPGTTTSDSIPAHLSKGEYVIPAHIVQQYGVGFFDHLLGLNSPGVQRRFTK